MKMADDLSPIVSGIQNYAVAGFRNAELFRDAPGDIEEPAKQRLIRIRCRSQRVHVARREYQHVHGSVRVDVLDDHRVGFAQDYRRGFLARRDAAEQTGTVHAVLFGSPEIIFGSRFKASRR